MKKILLIVLLSGYFVQAQNQGSIDSLMKLISASRDTTRVNIYNQLAWGYRNSNLQLTDSFATLAINLSNSISYDVGTGRGYICLTLVERNAGNYAKAIDKARWALLHYVKAKYLPGYSSAYNTIASIHHIQGNYSVALYYYYKSLKIAEGLNDRNGIARTLNNIGVIYLDRGDYKKSLLNFYKAYNILISNGDENAIADELSNIGSVYQATNEKEKAIANYLRSININLKNNDLKNAFAGYNNIGTVYADMGDLKNALNYYFQAVAVNEKIGDVESTVLCYNNIAGLYIKMDMLHTALKYAHESMEIAVKHRLKNDTRTAYELLYQIEVLNKNFKDALYYHEFFKAYSDSIVTDSASERINYLEAEYNKAKLEKERIMEGKDSEINEKIHLEKEKRISQYIFIIGLILVIFVITIYVVFFILKWQKTSQ